MITLIIVRLESGPSTQGKVHYLPQMDDRTVTTSLHPDRQVPWALLSQQNSLAPF